MVKNTLAHAGDMGDAGLIPGSARFLGGGDDNPLQYSCLETTAHEVAKSQTQLSN